MASLGASSARADGVPPPTPLVATPAASPEAPPPAPPPSPDPKAADDAKKAKAKPAVEPGAAPGLYSTPPDENLCTLGRCLQGIPETRMPLYDPISRMQLPWTGEYNPCVRPWTFFASESVTYDSNIFASDHGVESDWISNTSVGASYRREGAAYWAMATGSLTYQKYFDHENEDGLNGYANFKFGWAGAAAYWSIDDSAAYQQSPIVVRDNTFTIVSQRLEHYWQNTMAAHLGYDGPCWKGELTYSSDLFWADSGVVKAFNHWEQGFGARFDYYVSEKTSLGAYAGYRFIPYQDPTQRDFDIWSGGGTFSWRPTAIFGIGGSLGASGTLSTGTGTDNTSYAADLEASWDVGPCASLFLGYSHTFEPSLGADDQIVDLFRLRAQTVYDQCWTFSASTGVQFGNTQGATADGTKDYTLFFLDLMFHRPLGDRWNVDGGYQFRTQNSSANGIDFDQHRVTVGLSFTF